jgi:hypothetical protein
VAGKITPTVAPGSKDVRKEASNLPAVDPNEIRQLSDQIERVVFHKQFTDG